MRVQDKKVKFTSYKSVKNGGGLLPIQWHKVTIEHSDLTAAATTESIDVSVDDDGNEIPDGSRIIGAGVKVWVPFDEAGGASISALTVQVGDAGDTDELFTATSVYTGTATAGQWLETGGAYTALTRESDYAVAALFTATGGNVSLLDTGRLEVWIAYVRLSDPYSAE